VIYFNYKVFAQRPAAVRSMRLSGLAASLRSTTDVVTAPN